MYQQLAAFENIVRKEEIALNEQISSFPTMFSTQTVNFIPICQYFSRNIFI